MRDNAENIYFLTVVSEDPVVIIINNYITFRARIKLIAPYGTTSDLSIQGHTSK